MRHKIILTIIGLLALTNIAKSQSAWAPVGTQWYYTMTYAFSPNIGYNFFESVKDTTIQTHLCSKIQKLYGSCDIRPQVEFMYSDSNRVYFFDESMNKFILLYDFNKTSGEEWYIQIYNSWSNPDSVLVHVDSVSYESFNNQQLKVLHTTINHSASFEWAGISGEIIERIGHTGSMFPFVSGTCDADFNSGIRCYEDSLLGFIHLDSTVACDYVHTGISEIENEELYVYPNPTTDNLYIKTDMGNLFDIRISDLAGQIYYQSKMNNECVLDLSGFLPGLYFLTLTNKEMVINKKIIRQ